MGVERDGLAGYKSYRGLDPTTGAATSDSDFSGSNNWITPAPASNVSLVITDITLSMETAGVLAIYEETATTPTNDRLIMRFPFAAAGATQWTPRSKVRLAVGKRIRVQSDNPGQATALAQYTYENSNVPY